MAGFSVRNFAIEGRFEIRLDDSDIGLVVWLAQEESDDGVDWVLNRVEVAGNHDPLKMAQVRALPLSRIAAIARIKMHEWEKQIQAEAQH